MLNVFTFNKDRSPKSRQQGSIIIEVLAFASIGVLILSGLVQWALLSVSSARHSEGREQAILIAEAGIDYYRWHLAHAPTDFQDGTATSGPYVHNYYIRSGEKIGTYTLVITPPPLGSTMVTIRSTGRIDSDPSISRTIEAKFAKPSFAKYAVISNSDISIGADIYGPMHSNGGIYMNSGTAYNVITSAKTTFNSTTTGFVTKWGVYTDTDPNPPTAYATVTARFTAGREVGKPALDFDGITVDLAQLKTSAQSNGNYYAASGALGYHIVLQTNDTYDLYRVNTAATGGGSCEARQWWTYPSCPTVANAKWSVNGQTLIGNDIPFPANGIIFAEDHVWVDGTINSARLTIIAATIPDVGARKNIIVNSDLRYTNYDGQDVLGLIAQDNFFVGVVSANTLRIDGAIIAQHGRVSRYAYRNCGAYSERTSITFYGMFASNQRYAYGNLGGVCTASPGAFASGYNTDRTYIYDPNLLYGPPPSFPLTADQYQIISWDEI